MRENIETIHKKIKSAYRGKIRSIAVSSGIHPYIRSIYGKVISSMSDDIQEHHIEEYTVRYHSDEYASWERQRSFEGELPVMKHFAEDISHGDTVWDVGANMGTYTCLAGTIAEDISVVAFEPAPSNIKRLKKNLDLNDINGIVRQEALDKNEGGMGLAAGSGGDGQYALTKNSDEIQVSTVDGDSLIDSGEVPAPNIVKIDVEGAEARVIKGMQSALQNIDILYIEIHPKKLSEYGDSVDELEKILSSAHLEYNRIHSRGDQYFLRAAQE